MAESCISYLLLDDFSRGPLHYAEFVRALSKFPLLQYAAQNWTFHVQMSEAEFDLLPLIRLLMTTTSNPRFCFWLQVVLYDSRHGYLTPDTDLVNARPLYYAASYGLTETVRSLVQAGADLDERAGRFGGTALHAAVWRKRPEILDILLDAGADPTIQDDQGSSASDLSIYSGARLLHSRIVDKARGGETLTPLIQAILKLREKELNATYSNTKTEGSELDTPTSKELVSVILSQPPHIIEQLREDQGVEHDPNALHFPAVRKEAYALAQLLMSSKHPDEPN
jgi:hypothetical protein